jgi:hypothetical protein
MGILVLDLIIDGIDDFGTTLYLIHLIRNIFIIGISLILSISFKDNKNSRKQINIKR